ncbi:glycosyltransferase family protein [Profundibacter sp.]
MQVLIAVTHLLGAGHLSRALTLARAFVAAGHSVTVVSGGMPVAQFDSAGIDLWQLPALRSDGVNFTRLLTPQGAVADVDYLATRQREMRRAVIELRPDIVISELFPFGRRVLRGEFLGLLNAARGLAPRPVILASIRDILAPPSKPEKAQSSEQTILDFYDGVLVHSDPASTPLEQSWPVTDALNAMLHYTGYVAPTPSGPHADHAGEGEVLVSAGGGSVGQNLFQSAVAAARLSGDLKWRILVGGADPVDQIKRLQKQAGDADVTVEAARPDFRKMLYHAAVSVSMCGYNTALDLMQAGTPALFIPFDEGGEVEQTLRAQSLSHLAGFRMCRAADLTPQRLLAEVTELVKTRRGKPAEIQFDGAAQAVRIAVEMARARAC